MKFVKYPKPKTKGWLTFTHDGVKIFHQLANDYSILANRQKFADTFRITIEQVDQLINLVTIAEKTQTNYHNGNASEEQANKAVAKVEEFATNVMKAETQWPDLFPLFSFNGKQYELPE